MRRMAVIAVVSAFVVGGVPSASLGAVRPGLTRARPARSERAPTRLARPAAASIASRHRRGRWRFTPYGPVGVSGPEVSSAYGSVAPLGERVCGGRVRFGGDPYRVVVWVGEFRHSVSCRAGKAALIASVRWKRGTIRLGASECAPVVVAGALRPSCRVRLSKPAGWECEFRAGDATTGWPVTCSARGATLTAAWASPAIGTRIVWDPSIEAPSVPPVSSLPSLAVFTSEVDGVTIHRRRGPHHRWLWSYEIYPFVTHQYVVIGVARACGASAGETEAMMRSVRGDRLFFAQTSESALGDKTRYIPVPPAGRYVVCDFFQHGPADPVAVLAGERHFTVPNMSPREPQPAPP